MSSPRSNNSPVFTVAVVAIVAAALLVLNIRERRIRILSIPNDQYVTRRGWPFTYYERDNTARQTRLLMIKRPEVDLRDKEFKALVYNIVLALLMLSATAVHAEYLRRKGTGPFLFDLQFLLIAIFAVSAIAAVILNGIATLLYAPIVLSLVSVVFAVGLFLRHYVFYSRR